MKYTIASYSALLFFCQVSIGAIDNPHFYRATNFFGEPRLEHNYLTSFDITLGGGSSHHSRNNIGNSVPLFDIYGKSSLRNLAANVPNLDPENPLDQILIALAQLPARKNFATLSTHARFEIIESNLFFTHNVRHGLFLLVHLPIRKLTIDEIVFKDLSPDDTIFPNKNTPTWQDFLRSFNPILQQFNLSAQPFHAHGIGDLTCSLGWTHNYQETVTLDFIDFSCMAGLLAPTGKRKHENQIFSLPLGYDGHWGLPVSIMGALGIYDWVTIGGYIHALFFADRDKKIHLKTSLQQQGIIKLAENNVRITKGSLWNTGVYCKADHCAWGLSCMFGYSCAVEQARSLKLITDNTAYTNFIINTDSQNKGWSMHTFHFGAEYDFTKENATIGSRIGFFYNYPFAGKRIFTTKMTGGSYGLDISIDL